MLGEKTCTDPLNLYKPATTSVVLAKDLGVNHKNLLRTIYKYTEEVDRNFNALNFELVEYLDMKGEKRPMFNLSTAAARCI